MHAGLPYDTLMWPHRDAKCGIHTSHLTCSYSFGRMGSYSSLMWPDMEAKMLDVAATIPEPEEVEGTPPPGAWPPRPAPRPGPTGAGPVLRKGGRGVGRVKGGICADSGLGIREQS